MSPLADPPLVRDSVSGFGIPTPVRKRRVVLHLTAAFSGYWPGDVYTVAVLGVGGGASGAKSSSTTTGSGGGGGAQACVGTISVTPGDAYSGTVGVGGFATQGGAAGNTNGNAGSNSTLINGTRFTITLLGGNPGLASGAAGGVAGPATYTSLHGLTFVQGAAGGAGQNAGVGLPGGNVDMFLGGLGGNTSGGGGGGASLFSRGGNGGNNGVAATDTPAANSGAGTGGGGADASTVGQYGSPTAPDGGWILEYWTEEEGQ